MTILQYCCSSNDISALIAQVYHHIPGSLYQAHQKYSLKKLAQLVHFDAAYWLIFNLDGTINNVITFNLEANSKRRFDRAFKNKSLAQQIWQRQVNHNAKPKTASDFTFLHDRVSNVKSEHCTTQSFVEQTYDKTHLLILISNESQKQTIEPAITQFVFCRIIHSLKLNQYLNYHSDRLRPNSYKAICREDLYIIEAELNFYKLLQAYSPKAIQDGQFSKRLLDKLTDNNQFAHQKIIYSVAPHGKYSSVEIYYDDPRLNHLTPKRLEIIRLLYLDRKEIATRLNMSIRTLDSHLAAIYDEFGTREKKKILAEIYKFSSFNAKQR